MTGTAYGIRPVINLKSGIQQAGGSGTINDPFILKGDKEAAVANTTLLNTRNSGEYIKLEGDTSERVFRIVNTEKVVHEETNDTIVTTKVLLNDYRKEARDYMNDLDFVFE